MKNEEGNMQMGFLFTPKKLNISIYKTIAMTNLRNGYTLISQYRRTHI